MIRDIHTDSDIIAQNVKGFVYILLCCDGTYYTGSTRYLWHRLEEHRNGEGANHTKRRLPVELVYFEIHSRIDHAFDREKQIQGWSRNKKEALIDNNKDLLHGLSTCKNETNFNIYLSRVNSK